MAVSAYAIPTLAEVKAFLKIATADTDLDSTLEGWIDRSSLAVEGIIGNKVVVQSVSSEILDGDGTDKIYPKYWPVTQVSTETSPSAAQKLAAVQYRTNVDGSWTDLLDDADHIVTNTEWDYILLYNKTTPVGDQNIKISYKAGYSTVPGEIWMVAVEMVAWWYRQSNQADFALGKQSSSSSGMGTNVSTSWRDMMAEWEHRLKPYTRNSRRPSVARLWR